MKLIVCPVISLKVVFVVEIILLIKQQDIVSVCFNLFTFPKKVNS